MKKRPSKLDPHADLIRELRIKNLTLEQIAGELHELGCDVSLSRLSDYVSAQADSELEQKLFETIASGGRMNKELDVAFKSNPAPEIEQLISITKTLVMSLQVKGAADPKLLNIANNMQAMVLEFLSAQTKALFKERELVLKERKDMRESDEFISMLLEKARELLANNSLTQADRIAAMRKAAFKDVEALEQSGNLQIPK